VNGAPVLVERGRSCEVRGRKRLSDPTTPTFLLERNR
jgi:hypothetical protein